MSRAKDKTSNKFDKSELLQNAITSIQLGVEDFQSIRSKNAPERSLSSARNIFAGVLLLFKYKIASMADTPDRAKELIFEHQEFLPYKNDSGKIEWRPSGIKPKTIDVNGIQNRFGSLNIKTDWEALKKINKCRNALEHLHPEHPAAEVEALIADIFPVLQAFISCELNDNPADLLGETWQIMLRHHKLFEANMAKAKEKWSAVELPPRIIDILQSCRCENCGSKLLQPSTTDVEEGIPVDSREFRYECIACQHESELAELVEDVFVTINGELDCFASEPAVTECAKCGYYLFFTYEATCYWCGNEERAPICSDCGQVINRHEAERGFICDRCDEKRSLFDEYE